MRCCRTTGMIEIMIKLSFQEVMNIMVHAAVAWSRHAIASQRRRHQYNGLVVA